MIDRARAVEAVDRGEEQHLEGIAADVADGGLTVPIRTAAMAVTSSGSELATAVLSAPN
jgi:hypothetical protein